MVEYEVICAEDILLDGLDTLKRMLSKTDLFHDKKMKLIEGMEETRREELIGVIQSQRKLEPSSHRITSNSIKMRALGRQGY